MTLFWMVILGSDRWKHVNMNLVSLDKSNNDPSDHKMGRYVAHIVPSGLYSYLRAVLNDYQNDPIVGHFGAKILFVGVNMTLLRRDQ